MPDTTRPVWGLTAAERAAYERDGFLVVRDLLSAAEVAALRARVRAYTHEGRPWGQVRFQVEPRVARGELKVDHPGDGIRKIDGLVEHDDLFRGLGTHPHIVGLITAVLGADLKMFRNSLLLKPPRVGSQKGFHQDSPYWPIAPMALCSCWFALDDTTPENGCMQVIPGAHRGGALPHVNVTDDFVIEPSAYDPAKAIMAPVPAGGGLFFHSLLPHYTAPNRSDKWRRAIALSYMSARSTYTGKGECPVYFPIAGTSYPGCVR